MNEEALQEAFRLFASQGYNGDINKFVNLISTNQEALQEAHRLFTSEGYNGDINKFKTLIGVGQQPAQQQPAQQQQTTKIQSLTQQPPAKKKEPTVSSSEGGLSGWLGSSIEGFVEKYQPRVEEDKPEDVSAWKRKVQQGREEQKIKPALPATDYMQGYLKEEGKGVPFIEEKKEPLSFLGRMTQEKIEEESPEFTKIINSVNSDIIDKGVDSAAKELNYYFRDAGFSFAPVKRNGFEDIIVRSPNGEQLMINIGGWSNDDTAEEIKNFIKKNYTRPSDIKKVEKMYLEENKKFINEEKYNEEVSKLNTFAEDFKNSTKTLLSHKAEIDNIEKKIKEYPQNLINTPQYQKLVEDYNQRIDAYNTNYTSLEERAKNLEAQDNALKKSVGEYTKMKSEQGTVGGYLWNKFTTGAGKLTSGFTNFYIDRYWNNMPLPWLLGQEAYEEEMKNVALDLDVDINKVLIADKDFWKLSDYEKRVNVKLRKDLENFIRDDYKKMVKYGEYRGVELNTTTIKDIREFFLKNFGTSGTTKEYAQRIDKEGNIVIRGLGGLAESAPSMLTPIPGMRMLNMYMLSTDAVREEMENDPDFKDISENEKEMVLAPIGIVGAVLEEVGLRNLLKGTSIIKNLTGRVINNIPAGATASQIRNATLQEIKNMGLKGGAVIVGGALSEAETGALQQMNEYAVKDLYNVMKGKDMFDTPIFMSQDYINKVSDAAATESVGGFTLSIPGAISAALSKDGFQALDDDTFKIFEELAKDNKIRKFFVIDLKNKINKGEITAKQSQQMLDAYDQASGMIGTVDEEITDIQSRKIAMDLISERKKLEAKKDKTDPALAKPIQDKIDNINKQLIQLTQDAIQKQAASEVSLQPETEPGKEMEAGGPEAGPQAAPQQGVLSPEESEKEALTNKKNKLEQKLNELQQRQKQELEALNKKENKSYADPYDILNVNEFSEDQSQRSQEAIDLANRQNKEFQDLIQERNKLQSESSKLSYSSYDFSNNQQELDNLRNSITDVYQNDRQALDEGFAVAPAALDEAVQVGGDQYVAHGMAKTSLAKAFSDLINLFSKGIDPNMGRGSLDVATLAGGAAIGTTSSGNAYMDGPFTLVANRNHQGAITDINQVGGIIVNEGMATPEVLDSLRKLFPNLIIESTSNTKLLVEQLNNKKSEQQATTEGLGTQAETATKEQETFEQKKSEIEKIVDPEQRKVAEIEFIMSNLMSGVGEAAANKIREYADRIISGKETRDQVIQGLPKSFVNGIDQLLAAQQSPTTEQQAAPVQPAEQQFTEQDRARKAELEEAMRKADKRRKNITVGETVMTKADVKAELDALNQKELSSQQPIVEAAPVTEVAPVAPTETAPVQTLTPEQEADKLEQMMLAKMGAPKVEAAPITEGKVETENEKTAKRIRGKKMKGTLSTLDFGITQTVYNGALEFMARQVEKGTKLGNAIANTMKWIDDRMGGKKWDKGAFGKYMNDTYKVTLGDGRQVDVLRDDSKETADVINGWYSEIEQRMLDAKEESLPANKWAEKLRSKEDEDLWTGVRDFLQSKGSETVSKKEIKDFIKNNRVEIVEVVKGDLSALEIEERDRIQSEINKNGEKIIIARLNNDTKLLSELQIKEKELFEKLKPFSDRTNENITKFSQYQLDGDKENYKEVLVTLPSAVTELPSNYKTEKTAWDTYQIKDEKGNVVSESGGLAQATVDALAKINKDKGSTSYIGGHFTEPNILVHLRMNTRTDADGNKVLFLEEVQSDWGQEGKKKGFEVSQSEKIKDIENKIKAAKEKQSKETDFIKRGEIYNNEIVPLELALSEAKGQDRLKKIPTAPFVMDTNAWVKLGLKVALREAAAQGATKIAWTTGEQQNERYSLEKVADEVRYSKNPDGTYRVIAYKKGENVSENRRLQEDKLEETLGKDVAQRIIDGVGEEIEGVKSLTGENLSVGGTGMKGFYGSPTEGSLGIIGNVAKSLFKQDPKIVQITTRENLSSADKIYEAYDRNGNVIKRGNSESYIKSIAEQNNGTYKLVEARQQSTQNSIDVTPELKQSVQKGLPLFSNINLSDAVRGLKIKGPGGLQSNILGVPIAIWNAAMDTVAKAIDAGVALSSAVQKGYDYIKDKHKAINKERYEAKVLNRMYSGAIEIARNPVDPKDKISDAGIKIYLMKKGLTESQADALLAIKPKAKEKITGKPKLDETKLPGYNEMMDNVDAMIARQTKRGTAVDKMAKNLDALLRKFDAYINATDAQKKALEQEARNRIGAAQRIAPSFGRILGAFKDLTAITTKEKSKIVNNIMQLAKDAAKDLAKEIKGMKVKGKITTSQLTAIQNRLSKVNFANEASVQSFVDYMANVFSDVEYAGKIARVNSLLGKAKENVKTKIGVSEGLTALMNKLFSINPNIIPAEIFEAYSEIVEMMGKRQAVLTLKEANELTKDVEKVLDVITDELSNLDELIDIFDNYENKVLDENGKIDFSATLDKMLEDGTITPNDVKLYKKYKNKVLPREAKEKKTEQQLAEEKKELIDAIRQTKVDESNLNMREERDAARNLISAMTPENLNGLTNAELANLLKVLDNINNGFFPHYAVKMTQKLNATNRKQTLGGAIKTAGRLPLTKLIANIKSLFPGAKSANMIMVIESPKYVIDQVFGFFKKSPIYDSVFKPVVELFATYKTDAKAISEKLEKAYNKVAKSHWSNPAKVKMSQFKMMTYALQLEYQSNKDKGEKFYSAAEYIKETIKHTLGDQSTMSNRDVQLLEKILNTYGVKDADGNFIDINIDKLYDSFNNAEKQAIKTIQEVNASIRDKAMFTAAAINGNKIMPIDNYVHHNVLPTGTNTANLRDPIGELNKKMNPSTRAAVLKERTPGAKPLNFNIFDATQKSANEVLMDFHLTEGVRTSKMVLSNLRKELEERGDKKQLSIFNAIEKSFETALENTLTNTFNDSTFVDNVVSFITKQAYRTLLAGVSRWTAELASNLAYVLKVDPVAYIDGLTKYRKYVLSEKGPAILRNIKSGVQDRVYEDSILSGRMIDGSIMNEAIGLSGTTSNYMVVNAMQTIYNNTLKKGQNFVASTADTLISTPDKGTLRPFYIGIFAKEFKKITGQNIDLDKIAANDEAYLKKFKEAIDKSKDFADYHIKLAGGTKNPFASREKSMTVKNASALAQGYKSFNNFMNSFIIGEYIAARTGIYAMMGNGKLTRKQGAAVLAGVVARTTLYTILIKELAAGVAWLFLGDDDEEDEEKVEKSLIEKSGQAFAGSMTSLILGRDFGNLTRNMINYGVEKVNENYVQKMIDGKYTKEDVIAFNSLIPSSLGSRPQFSDLLINMSGAGQPFLRSAKTLYETYFADEPKGEATIKKRQNYWRYTLPLEIAGHLGFVPLYKDVKSVTNKALQREVDKIKGEESGGGIIKRKKFEDYDSAEEFEMEDPEGYAKYEEIQKRHRTERRADKKEFLNGYDSETLFKESDEEGYLEAIKDGSIYEYKKRERKREEEKNQDKPFFGYSEEKFKKLYPDKWAELYGPGTDYYESQRTPEALERKREERRREAEFEAEEKKAEAERLREAAQNRSGY